MGYWILLVCGVWLVASAAMLLAFARAAGKPTPSPVDEQAETEAK